MYTGAPRRERAGRDRTYIGKSSFSLKLLHRFASLIRANRSGPIQKSPAASMLLTPVRTLKTSEAATLLNVSANTLRAWERRFGYPKPLRSPGRHRLYTHGEVAALRDALQEGLSISSAISRARESLRADTYVLVGALNSFELDRADSAM